jgi:hypothetical protein
MKSAVEEGQHYLGEGRNSAAYFPMSQCSNGAHVRGSELEARVEFSFGVVSTAHCCKSLYNQADEATCDLRLFLLS